MGAGKGRSRRASAVAATTLRDESQARFLADKLAGVTAQQPEWSVFSERLLSLGGAGIAALLDEDMGILLERGREWPAAELLMIPGETSGCHGNAAALHAGDSAMRVVTGWALSDDGVWRQHSWCVTDEDGEERVVETTTPRAVYYGAELEGDELEEFLFSNE